MPTIHHTLQIGGVEIECRLDHTPETPDTWDCPGNEDEYELIDARIGTQDAGDLVCEHLWGTLMAELKRPQLDEEDQPKRRVNFRSWFANLSEVGP